MKPSDMVKGLLSPVKPDSEESLEEPVADDRTASMDAFISALKDGNTAEALEAFDLLKG